MANENRFVVITGGTGALGTAVSEIYLKQGCQVAIPYIENDQLQSFQNKIGDLKSRVMLRQANVTVETEVKNFFQAVLDKFDQLDVLVNIVGGFVGGTPVAEMELEDWNRMMDTNLKSAFLCCRDVLPHMIQRKYGKIVNISARAGLTGIPELSAYCVSKSGVRVLTESIAHEVKDFGINVNSIMPSIIDTPTNRNSMPNQNYSGWVPPSKIAEVVYFLTSDAADIINGAAIPVYGRA